MCGNISTVCALAAIILKELVLRDIKATRNTKYWLTHLGLSALFTIVAYGCGYSDASQSLNLGPGISNSDPYLSDDTNPYRTGT